MLFFLKMSRPKYNPALSSQAFADLILNNPDFNLAEFTDFTFGMLFQHPAN